MTAPANVAVGDLITASFMNNLESFYGGSVQTYTPALTATTTNPTLGTGSTATGRYVQVGKVVACWGNITFGTAGVAAGSGTYLISLPVTSAGVIASKRTGIATLTDSSATASAMPFAFQSGTTTIRMSYPLTWPSGTTTPVTNAAPWTWAASDSIDWVIVYEAA